VLSVVVVPGPHVALGAAASGRNVIVIVTDDQSIGMLARMPNVRALAETGFAFRRAFISNPLCCPSRATILTGLYSHETGVYSNADGGGLDRTYGGWGSFQTQGLDDTGQRTIDNEDRTLPVFLDEHGYDTALFGKYLNHYGHRNGADIPDVPPGWDTWRSFDGPNGAYYDYWVRDADGIRYVSKTYSTDFFGKRANGWLASTVTAPFFLYFAPYAPHGPSIPAPRDEGITATKGFDTPAFNEANVSDKPRYIRRLGLVDAARMQSNYDRSVATLVDVDRWVGRFVATLRATGHLQDAVIVFLSDNGTTHGDHRWTGKLVPYERSIRVPLLIAGPSVSHGSTKDLVSNVDITPTVLDIAGLLAPDGTYTDVMGGTPTTHRFDGVSLLPRMSGDAGFVAHPDPFAPGGRSVLLEHLSHKSVPSFCGLRTPRWKFVIYRGGFRELYDLRRDPYELRNVAGRKPHLASRMLRDVTARCLPAPPDFPA
jgi:N-acetylglucosamine-6-sulfatase